MRRTSYARVTADTQTLQTCLSDGVTLAGRYPRDWESTRPRASTASNTPYTSLVLDKRLGFTASDLAHLRAPATLHLPPCCTWCEQVFNESCCTWCRKELAAARRMRPRLLGHILCVTDIYCREPMDGLAKHILGGVTGGGRGSGEGESFGR